MTQEDEFNNRSTTQFGQQTMNVLNQTPKVETEQRIGQQLPMRNENMQTYGRQPQLLS
jgi:hypothetical protein